MGISILSTVLLTLALVANAFWFAWTYKFYRKTITANSGDPDIKRGLKFAALCLALMVGNYVIMALTWFPFFKSLPTK
jgi:hypothetical protein